VDALPVLNVQEDLRVGSTNDPEVGFTRIRGVAVDSDEQLYVLEGMDKQIRVYDKSGRRVRVIGRDGEGPGEFRSPIDFGVFGDSVWVNDARLNRVTIFNRAGEVIGMHRTKTVAADPISGIPVLLIPRTFSRDRSIMSTWQVNTPQDPAVDSIMLPIVRFDTLGSLIDTIQYVPFHFHKRSAPFMIEGRPFYPPSGPYTGPISAATDQASYLAEQPIASSANEGIFTVTRVANYADTTYHRQYRYRPRRFNDALVDTIIRRSVGARERLDGLDPNVVEARLRSALELPPFQPPLTEMHSGDDGTLWISREDDAEAERRWILLDDGGDPIGIVHLPRRGQLQWASRTTAWILLPDEFDVPWLVRYRVTPPGGALADARPQEH
jgi:hypothetical protein